MTTTDQCIFCRIATGEVTAAKVYEDTRLLAFLDINPVQPGHLLIIPKEHYQWMIDLPEELTKQCFTTAQRLMKVLQKARNADFVVLSVVGVDVPHFHIHLVPRWHHDGLSNFWPGGEYAAGQMETVAQELRETIQKEKDLFSQ